MGPPPRSFAADAYYCIMVLVPLGPTEYKYAARCFALNGELPSDRVASQLPLWFVTNDQHQAQTGLDYRSKKS
jgi:hypothetical protein